MLFVDCVNTVDPVIVAASNAAAIAAKTKSLRVKSSFATGVIPLACPVNVAPDRSAFNARIFSQFVASDSGTVALVWSAVLHR